MIGSMISKACMAMSILVGLGAVGSFAKDVKPAKIAIANFDFVDTSGEVRTKQFGMKRNCANSKPCYEKPFRRIKALNLLRCHVRRSGAPGIDQLLRQAKAADARYLLAGGLHKMSTLIGWAKFIVFDLEKSGQVCDRLLTYRGDTAEAWRRAAKFSAGDIIKYCFADTRQHG